MSDSSSSFDEEEESTSSHPTPKSEYPHSEGCPPPCKKLRFAEMDLRVIVGENNKGEKGKEYLYHRALLASQSDFVEAALTSSMKESKESVIRFPELDPDTWESMICFLSPSVARTMDHKDAQELAPHYDKYGFVEGLICCDDVLKQCFRDFKIHSPKELEEVVDLHLTVDSANLPETKIAAKVFFRGFFDKPPSNRRNHSVFGASAQEIRALDRPA